MTPADASPAPGHDAHVPPRRADGLVLRRPVLEHLSDAGMRVAVITAPAGYGKTSHGAAWVAADERPVAWIDLEPGHDDAPRLARGLVAALAAVTDIDLGPLPSGTLTPDQYSTQFASALGRAVRASSRPFVLVLDDVHRLTDLTALDVLSALVENVPDGSAILLVGRTCPLEQLSRLRIEPRDPTLTIDAAGVRRVNLRASGWFEASGDVDRAVQHAVAAGDLDLAERLVVEGSPAAYTNGRYATIRRWIESIPLERVVQSAALCLCAALTAVGRADGDELRVWLRLGEHAARTDAASRLGLAYLRSTTNTGAVRPALEDAAAAYHGLPPGIWHAGSCLAFGVWTWTVDDGDAAAILTEGAEEATVLGAPALAAYCTAVLALIAHAEHEPHRAWTLAERAHRIAVEHALEDAPGMALVSSVHALACATTGDPTSAREAWQRARTQLAQLRDLSGWANVQSRVALAHTSLLLGDRVGAETVLAEAREFLVRQPDATRAIRQVEQAAELVARMRAHPALGSSSLTTAELRVLHYLPTNLTLAELGARLYVSRYTVKTHCASIYRKLDAQSRSEAVATAGRLGLLGSVDGDD